MGAGAEEQSAPGDFFEKINPALCRKRLDTLYERWESDDPVLSKCDALLFLTGKTRDDENLIAKLGAFHLWALTLIFPETLIIFFRDRRIAFSARSKKMAYFQDLENTEMGEAFKLEFYARESSSGFMEFFTQPDGLLDSIKKVKPLDETLEGICFGTLLDPDTIPSGQSSILTMQALKFPHLGVGDLDENGYTQHPLPPEQETDLPKFRYKPIDVQISRIILKQDAFGLENSISAGTLAGRMTKEVIINRVVHILDQELKETHGALCSMADAVLDDREKMAKWKNRFKVDAQAAEFFYTLVESGRTFTLDPGKIADDSMLHLGRGSIVIGIGVKYNNQAASIARTILMDVGSEEKKMYQSGLDIQAFLATQIKPGKIFSDVYKTVWEFASTKHPKLLPFLKPNFGGALANRQRIEGFEFTENSDQLLESKMTIAFGISALNIVVSDAPISIWLFDTCICPDTDTGEPTISTSCCPKKLEDVVYSLETEEPPKTPKQNSKATDQSKSRPGKASGSRGKDETNRAAPGVAGRVRTRRAQAGLSQAEAERLLAKQRELRKKKQDEIAERFRDGGIGFSKDKKDIKKLSQMVSYRDPAEFPRDLKANKVHVDFVRESVLIPVGNIHIPFHVSTLRNVSHQDEDAKTHALRIAFHVPGATVLTAKTEESPLPDLSNVSQALFVKELIIRSSDPNIVTTFKNIRELMKRAKTREANKKEDDVTVQQALTMNRTAKRVVLRNLMARHTGGHQKKLLGQLEAHVNGFRYMAPKSEPIDIIYSNVRHAFFQPVSNEMIVLVHFHLKSPIMIARKKVKDLQFYCETSSQADDLDARRNRSAYDPDEILEEQREQERKRRLNADFKRFVEAVQELAPGVEFEVPIRKLSFHGVPRNSSVVLMPTTSCLVHLSEWPAFILSMDDVELVSFERVVHGLRHFDAIFINKDYNKHVCPVANIPVESLDMLKSWLNDMDIVWYEGKNNLTWMAILKTIRSDIACFVSEGAFSSFLGDDTEVKRKKRNNNSDADSPGASSDSGDDATSDDDDDDDEYKEQGSSESDGSEDEEEGSEDEDEDEDEIGSEGSGDDLSEDSLSDEEEETRVPPSSKNKKRQTSSPATKNPSKKNRLH